MFDPSAQYQLTVCPLGRSPADEYYHQGQTWIEGREGSTYTLGFHNRSSSRVLVILSVDGLDVLRGQPAGHLSEGYVVEPNSSINVPGWKVDNNTAAEFFFSKVGKSYVTKMGQNASNAGVIGAMVFMEAAPITMTQSPFTYVASPQVYPHNGMPNWSSITAGSIGAVGSVNSVSLGHNASSVTRSSNNISYTDVGTGFGRATDWNTISTTFRRANPTMPNAIMPLYYDSARGLQRRGIVLKSKYATSSNNPFPAYTSGAIPPPDWQP